MAAELGEHLTDEEVDKIFQKTDYDQDGYITAEDFYAVIAQREGVYDWFPSMPFELWTFPFSHPFQLSIIHQLSILLYEMNKTLL